MKTIKEIVKELKQDIEGNVYGLLSVEQLYIEVFILDVRQAWGRTDYLVQPVQGQGQQWVSAVRVRQQ